MALKRMDNVGIVVEDLEATIDFFRELGLELEFDIEDPRGSQEMYQRLVNLSLDIAIGPLRPRFSGSPAA